MLNGRITKNRGAVDTPSNMIFIIIPTIFFITGFIISAKSSS